ncbi:hypothetical protein H5410_030521 [Solanum commersonii]|uniref:Uncharacterized protein n=1 Tax=Solanum commersonii TaxID=4109 RepID=A0A9J5YH48_SOLCO|nr:hypothetical protein H5410_030521 [Solanum commersonii]
MSKKTIVTPRKSPRLVEGTSTDEVHTPTFNILTQTPPPKNVETPAKGGSSHLKDQKEKKYEAKKRVSPTNQKGKKRKGKLKKATNVEVAQSSKPSTRRTTKKKESELPISEKGKRDVRLNPMDMISKEQDLQPIGMISTTATQQKHKE